MAGTRKEVLNRIYTCADSRGDSKVCLVHGPLGSRKTTVAATLAEKYDKENRQATTFFFPGDPRHDANRRFVNKVVLTIAYQSSITHLIVKKKIIQALNFNPTILFKSMETRFHNLVGSFWRRRFKFIRAHISGSLKVWVVFSFAQTFLDIWIAFVLNSLFPPKTANCRETTWFVFVVPVAAPAAVVTPNHSIGHPRRVFFINLIDFSADKDVKLFFEKGFTALKTKHLVYHGSGGVEEWPSLIC